MHFGMVIVGLPYSFQGQMTLDEVVGGAPLAPPPSRCWTGQRQPSAIELATGATRPSDGRNGELAVRRLMPGRACARSARQRKHGQPQVQRNGGQACGDDREQAAANARPWTSWRPAAARHRNACDGCRGVDVLAQDERHLAERNVAAPPCRPRVVNVPMRGWSPRGWQPAFFCHLRARDGE